jgi:hypothetical protein
MVPEKPSRNQVNIRLSQEEAHILQAIAFLEQRPAADVLRGPVAEYLAARSLEPDVDDAVTLLQGRVGASAISGRTQTGVPGSGPTGRRRTPRTRAPKE